MDIVGCRECFNLLIRTVERLIDSGPPWKGETKDIYPTPTGSLVVETIARRTKLGIAKMLTLDCDGISKYID
jgi:hypothetical protein